MTPTPEEVQQAVQQHGSMSAAARALNIGRAKVKYTLYAGGYKERIPSDALVRRVTPTPTTILGVTPVCTKKAGLSREQFAASFDNDTRVRNALRVGVASLNDDSIIEDAEFRVERCKRAPTNGWRKISEEPEFAPYRFTTRGRVFWGSVETKQWALENVEGVS